MPPSPTDMPLANLLPSPELNASTQLLAPSMTSDSTHDGLNGSPAPPSTASWGSGTALATAAGGMDERPRVPPGQSNLAHSTAGWNHADDDDEGLVSPDAAAADEKAPKWAADKQKKSRKGLWTVLAILALILIGLAVGLGVGLTVGKHNSHGSSAGGHKGSGSGTATSSGSAAMPTATSGGQGSTLVFEDGSTMIYNNAFGGTWLWDPANPFKNDALVNSWTPSLNQSWTWGVDRIFGVNLGGWLVTEPFIVSSLYEKYANGSNGQTAIDEYTLSQNMGDNLTAAMTEHYDTFITERDFAEIACAGLNWVRIPIAHWAIETYSDEPYLEGVAWKYFLKAIQWARKYGLRINLDLHTAPGSQNGWNHSGRQGTINWMSGIMGTANAQRQVDYIRTLAQFISQPQYAPVVQMFNFINEPSAGPIGKDVVGSFYLEAYNTIRSITGVGEGKGPMLSIHDGFLGLAQWYGFLPGADRLALDQHSYMVFGDQPTGTLDSIAHGVPCQWWAKATNDTSNQFGVNSAGEWSVASNDCGLWVNSVGAGARYDGTFAGYTGPAPGSCDFWNDYRQWNQSTIDDIHHLALASMDALQNWFFWTWKIGNSTGDIEQVNPVWHYRLGLEQGWIPQDPRTAVGTCAGDGVDDDDFSGTYASAYMTGGAGAGTIAADQSQSYPWPVSSITSVDAPMSELPQYTQTGDPITLSGPAFTSPGSTATIDAGSGWFNANDDSRKAYTIISGCSYPDEYTPGSLPQSACGAGLVQPTKRSAAPAVFPAATPAPQ